jgi:hypothetical protein
MMLNENEALRFETVQLFPDLVKLRPFRSTQMSDRDRIELSRP